MNLEKFIIYENDNQAKKNIDKLNFHALYARVGYAKFVNFSMDYFFLTKGVDVLQVEKSSESSDKKIDNFLSINKFCEKHPDFKPSSIRWWIVHSNLNGFESAIRRVYTTPQKNRARIFIKERAFFEWLDRGGACHE